MKGVFGFFLFHYSVGLFTAFLARLVFLLFNLSQTEDAGLFETLKCFYYGLPLDLSLVSYAVLPALLLHLFGKDTEQQKRKVLGTFYMSFAVLVFVVNLIDAELFSYWGTRINPAALFYAENPLHAAASVDGKMIFRFICLLAMQVVVFFYVLRFLLKKSLKHGFFQKKISISSVFLHIVLLAMAFLLLRGGWGKVPINQSRTAYSSNFFLNTSAVNGLWNLIYYVFNKKSTVKYEDFVVVEDSVLANFLQENTEAGEPLSPSLFRNTVQPNIILLIMESLSAETLRSIGGTFNWSEGLDAALHKGFTFSQMYSSGNRTDKGLVALLSGFPSQPVTSVLTDPERAAGLPTAGCLLSKKGYKNTFIYGGDAGFANMGLYLRNGCFDNVIDQKKLLSKTAKGSWGYHDQDVFKELKNRVQKTTSPFFVTALSLSVHEPFDIPNQQRVENKTEAAYRYSDSCLADFLHWFEQSEIYSNTLLIVTGDHGRDLEIKNKHFADKYKFHVPAVLLGGALAENYLGKKIEAPVSQTALLPFVLQNMDISVSPFAFYHNPVTASNPYALYFFDNGLGFVSKETSFILGNQAKPALVHKEGIPLNGYADFILFAQTYQQIIMKKYFALNRK